MEKIIDVTGDALPDYCERHALRLTHRFTRDHYDRPTLIYQNRNRTIILIAEPFYDGRIGETYMLNITEELGPMRGLTAV